MAQQRWAHRCVISRSTAAPVVVVMVIQPAASRAHEIGGRRRCRPRATRKVTRSPVKCRLASSQRVGKVRVAPSRVGRQDAAGRRCLAVATAGPAAFFEQYGRVARRRRIDITTPTGQDRSGGTKTDIFRMLLNAVPEMEMGWI